MVGLYAEVYEDCTIESKVMGSYQSSPGAEWKSLQSHHHDHGFSLISQGQKKYIYKKIKIKMQNTFLDSAA